MFISSPLIEGETKILTPETRLYDSTSKHKHTRTRRGLPERTGAGRYGHRGRHHFPGPEPGDDRLPEGGCEGQRTRIYDRYLINLM